MSLVFSGESSTISSSLSTLEALAERSLPDEECLTNVFVGLCRQEVVVPP